MTTRQFATISLNVQFDNEFQPPQFGAPALLTQAVVVRGPDGAPIYPPSHQMLPAVPSDIDDDMLAALQSKLGALGLTVARKASNDPT